MHAVVEENVLVGVFTCNHVVWAISHELAANFIIELNFV